MKQIVIGANGFLGSALVNELVNKHEVIAVYNNNRNNINRNAQCVKIDNLHTKTKENISTIYYVIGNHSSLHKELVYMNCDLLNRVIHDFKESKIVFVSSSNVYGNTLTEITEKSAFNNPNIYGLSKIAGEFITQSAKKYSIIRLCYLYGPNLSNNSFIPNIISQARKNQITLYGEGNREQDYLYIDDAVNLLIKSSLYEENGIFLGATGKSYSNLHIAKLLKHHNKNLLINFSGEEKGLSYFFDPNKTMKKLEWKPKTTIEEGIKNIWYENSNNG